MTIFSKYSRYYNLLYKDKDYVGEAEYVSELIRKYSPGAKSVLDLGCGTGRHDFLLAEKGYAVTGVDKSAEMLNVANAQLSSIDFLEGDIRTIRLDKQFDVVVSLFHVMSYQTANDDLNAAFKTASVHLKNPGLFLFDFWYGPAVLTERPEVRVKRLEDEDLSVCRTASPVMHLDDNIVDVNYEVLIEDKKTKKLEVLRENHKMRYFFLPELKFMLEAAGFSVVAERAWMHIDGHLSADNWSGVVIAQK